MEKPSVSAADTTPFSRNRCDALREEHYNSTVTGIRRIHDDLLVLRVRPDGEIPSYEPGQYTTLGLGVWEPRIDSVPPDRAQFSDGVAHLIRRAYSISCPMLDDSGNLIRCAECDFLEFYITLIHRATDRPSPLTPRLFGLQLDDRLHLARQPRGRYTLNYVSHDDENVIFLGTGTGEAPHNAMLVELLSRGHRGKIVVVTGVRHRHDLGYLQTHRELERRYPNYRYLELTTREPENIDPSSPGYVRKQYLQEFVASGDFVRTIGWQPEPQRTQVYLCGNPQMIGLPLSGPDGQMVFPDEPGMVECLVRASFRLDRPREPGNIHVEEYW